jgi:hypothetical protein
MPHKKLSGLKESSEEIPAEIFSAAATKIKMNKFNTQKVEP